MGKDNPLYARLALWLVTALLCQALVACGDSGAVTRDGASDRAPSELIVYCGRSRELIGPMMDAFQEAHGVRLRVRYGQSAELAALLTMEGERSPAHVFIAQDAGALGAAAAAGRLQPLPPDLLDRVDPSFRDREGRWIGLTGRERVIAYNPERVSSGELPSSLLELTDPAWRGRVGWAPTNGSFQAHVTALRLRLGDERTEAWLKDMAANKVAEYASNSEIVRAVADGRVDVGLVNNYYVPRLLEELGPDLSVRNHRIPEEDPTAMTNVAGAGLVNARAGRNEAAAEAAAALIRFLLEDEQQRYFAEKTHETPLALSVAGPRRTTHESPPEAEPHVDLSALSELRETLEMLRRTGVLP